MEQVEEINEPQSPLMTLPELVIIAISSHLPLADKRIMRLVSRFWAQVFDEERILTMNAAITDETVGDFLSSCHNMGSVVLQSISSRLIGLPGMNRRKIRKATIGCNNSIELLKEFLEQGTENLESLDVLTFALEEITSAIQGIVSGLDLGQLTALNLSVGINWNSEDWESCSEFITHAKLPNIRKFGFHINHKFGQSNRESPVWKLHRQFYDFILAHIETLVGLSYSIDSYQKNQFQLQKIPAAVQNALAQSNIHEYSLATGSFQSYTEAMVLLSKINCPLTKLKIHVQAEDWRNPYVLNGQQIEEIIVQHGNTLEELDLEISGLPQLSSTILNSCPNLVAINLNLFFRNLTGEALTPKIKSVQILTQASTFSFVQHNAESIEDLKIVSFESGQDYRRRPPSWMYHVMVAAWSYRTVVMTFSSLKTLHIDSSHRIFQVFISRSDLPVLKEFYACFCQYPWLPQSSAVGVARWLVQVAPNLEVGKIVGLKIDHRTVNVLKRLKRMKRLMFKDEGGELEKYCKVTPKIKMRRIGEESDELVADPSGGPQPRSAIDWTTEIIFN